jgi:tetratricopeptide (TPR) repeat protein
MNKKYIYLIIVILIIFSLIAFGRIAGNDFINYDDDRLITENSYIQSGFNAESIKWAFTNSSLEYWHPLTWLSIMLEWRLFGANASGYHIVSLLFHIGAALFLFLFLNKATKQLWLSAFAAALFALHPLRVESVAWVAERKDVLSMFFGMATLYAYVYYVEKKQLSKYFLCLILFTLSLMSKPTLVTLPCVLLLLDYWPLGRLQKALTTQSVPVLADKGAGKKKSKKLKSESSMDKKITKSIQSGWQLIGHLLWEKIPFFFLSLALGIMVIWQLKTDNYMTSMQHVPLSNRIINALVSYVAYLRKTFCPFDLAVFYPYQSSFPIWQILGAVLLLLAISIAVIYYIRKAPFFAVGWFWYLGTLFPVIGLMQTGDQAMADRYTYFPSIGIAIILTWGIYRLWLVEKLRKIIIISVAIILAVLTFLTWQQCGYWKNSTTLFVYALQVTKNNYVAHNNFGVVLADEGKIEEAINHYNEAIRISPDYVNAYFNRGIAYGNLGNYQQTIKDSGKAIELNPQHADAYFNRGIAYGNLGNYQQTIKDSDKAIQLNPQHADTYYNRGLAYYKIGNTQQAITDFDKAIQLNPQYADTYYNRGLAYYKLGNTQRAIENFKIAAKLGHKRAQDYLRSNGIEW